MLWFVERYPLYFGGRYPPGERCPGSCVLGEARSAPRGVLSRLFIYTTHLTTHRSPHNAPQITLSTLPFLTHPLSIYRFLTWLMSPSSSSPDSPCASSPAFSSCARDCASHWPASFAFGYTQPRVWPGFLMEHRIERVVVGPAPLSPLLLPLLNSSFRSPIFLLLPTSSTTPPSRLSAQFLTFLVTHGIRVPNPQLI